MRHFYIFLIFSMGILLSACGNKEKTVFNYEDYEVDEDSSEQVAAVNENFRDTLSGTPPKRADEYFDDFIYAFMRNPSYQRHRVAFPLTSVVDGVQHEIAENQWQFNSLYAGDDVYMSVFPSAKSTKLIKDTKVSRVLVHDLEFQKNNIKEYQFEKLEGEWKLTKIESCSMDSVLVTSGFMNFFSKFASDEQFQQQHVSEMIHFSIFDEETMETITGSLTREQWPDFAPELPTQRIMSVNYGQQNQGSDLRVVNITSTAGDAGVTLTFKKHGGTWMLTGFES